MIEGDIMNNLELEKMANEIRKDIVTAVHSAKSGHPAAFSMKDTPLPFTVFAIMAVGMPFVSRASLKAALFIT